MIGRRNLYGELRCLKAVEKTSDLRPRAITDYFDLLCPIYRRTPAYGHVGRNAPDFDWEKTDKVEELQSNL